jgi:hypothetical protein
MPRRRSPVTPIIYRSGIEGIMPFPQPTSPNVERKVNIAALEKPLNIFCKPAVAERAKGHTSRS